MWINVGRLDDGELERIQKETAWCSLRYCSEILRGTEKERGNLNQDSFGTDTSRKQGRSIAVWTVMLTFSHLWCRKPLLQFVVRHCHYVTLPLESVVLQVTVRVCLLFCDKDVIFLCRQISHCLLFRMAMYIFITLLKSHRSVIPTSDFGITDFSRHYSKTAATFWNDCRQSGSFLCLQLSAVSTVRISAILSVT